MQGPMSVAPMGKRLLALIIDWLLCALIASSVTGHALFGGVGDKHYFAAQYATAACRRWRPRLQVGGRAHTAAAVRRPRLPDRP
jgi:hypothetical protein